MILHVIDSFTDRPFAGNPAAVTLIDAFPDSAEMQLIAAEMNLAETAFVVRRADGDMDLRWFSPTVEVDLCGHATLAAAHHIGGVLRFHTKSGVLTCVPGPGGLIEMDFPADPPVAAEVAETGIEGITWFGRGRFDHLVVLGNAEAVRRLVPDLPLLAALGSRGVIVTAAGERTGVDCVSRVFAPNAGIAEDPVTGSAHCTLAEYWGGRTGKLDLVGVQASKRGGVVNMRRQGDRVVLGGRAVTVSEVNLFI